MSIKDNTDKLISLIHIDADKYIFKPWNIYFLERQVKLKELLFNSTWNDFFATTENTFYYRKIENFLTNCIHDSKKLIYPYPELLFSIFNLVSLHKIKVVLIAQDPYPGYVINSHGIKVPYATGCSFSIPYNCANSKPPSLNNIYQNLLRFNHIKKIPENGLLIPWIIQGCFLINASLTTLAGESNTHRDMWRHFSNNLINYINNNCENIVFLVWGKDANIICQNVDPDKHFIITSSHPSPYSFNKTFSGVSYGNDKMKQITIYPSYESVDHFGETNRYLRSVNKEEILWDLINIDPLL